MMRHHAAGSAHGPSHSVCVIVVTHDAGPWLSTSLEPLRDVPPGAAVIVVDNGSRDRTVQLIRERYPQFLLIESKENLGFGRANNLGLEQGIRRGSDYFVLLNQDATITWSDIHALCDVADRHPNTGVLSPLHLFSNDCIDLMQRRHVLTQNTEFIEDLVLGRSWRDVYPVAVTNAAIWLIPKRTLQSVGGFDPIFFHYGEDTDYCRRVQRAGLVVGLSPQVRGYHLREQRETTYLTDTNHRYLQYVLRLKYTSRSAVHEALHILGELIGDMLRGRWIRRHGTDRVRALWMLYRRTSEFREIRRMAGDFLFLWP